MHRPIVIAGSRAQFEDWCRNFRTNPNAAIYVDDARTFLELLDGGNTDVRLWGDFARNPAYQVWQIRRRA